MPGLTGYSFADGRKPVSNAKGLLNDYQDLDSEGGCSGFFSLSRWGLERHKVVLLTLPWVLLCIIVRVGLEVSPLQFTGIFSSETVTPFTTVSMFVIAIMLGGIMEDYKEAERLPAEMVSALDGVSEKLNFCELATMKFIRGREKKAAETAHHHGGGGGAKKEEPCCCCKRKDEESAEVEVFDSKHEHGELLSYVTCLLEYFAQLRSDQDILAITSTYAKYFSLKVNECAEVTLVESWEIFDAFDELRSSILRLSVIKNTNFIPSGHRLMQVLVVATVFLVTLARYDNGAPEVPGGGGGRRLYRDNEESSAEQFFIDNVSAYCNVGTYVFLFIYVLNLIDDLEDPFEYSVAGLIPSLKEVGQDIADGKKPHIIQPHEKGAADVDMFPFLELYARVASSAHRKDVLEIAPLDAGEPAGFMHGLRCSYNLLNEEGDPRLGPTEVLNKAEREDSLAATQTTKDRRRRFRELLEASTTQALLAIKTTTKNINQGALPRASGKGSVNGDGLKESLLP